MGFYCEHLFPWLMEKVGDEPKELMMKLRKETLDGITGKVLDIGFGIGFNLQHYPDTVTSVVALDPSEGMNRRAARFVAESSIPLTFARERAEEMSFNDGAFDAVVSTFTLCTVRNTKESLQQIRRVLKREGSFHFLEHVAASERRDRRLQDLLNPINKRVFCGCYLNRDTGKSITEAGFQVKEIKRLNPQVKGLPKFMAHLIQGMGVSP